MSFHELKLNYFDKDYKVVPIKPGKKYPAIDDWQNIDFLNKDTREYEGWGIAVRSGMSGIMALDIDVEDQETKAKIKELLPPVFCGKIGNKNRLPTIFFQKTDGFEDITTNGIELIIDARNCVLPPSIHPNGYPYEWVNNSLLDIEKDDLPILEKETLEKILAIVKKKPLFQGRHNKLVELCGAMIYGYKSMPVIIEELVKYDRLHHPIPYFTDESEGHTKEASFHAAKLADSVLKSHVANGFKYTPIENFEIDLSHLTAKPKIKPPVQIKVDKLPHWDGLGKVIFEHIYNSSPIPRSNLSWGSTMGILSILAGNKISLDGVHPNLNALVIAPSCFGKDTPLKAAATLLPNEYIGSGSYASQQAIVMNLPQQRKRIDILDEMKHLFAKMNDPKNNSGIAETLCTLFTSVGQHYAGYSSKMEKSRNENKGKGKVGECYSPFVNFIGALTPEAFAKSFSEDFIDEGLGSRILYFWDDRFKYATKPSRSIKDVPDELREAIEKLTSAPIIELTKPTDEFYIKDIEVSEEARNLLTNFCREKERENCEIFKKTGKPDSLVGRFSEMIRKLALLAAFSEQWDCLPMDMTLEARHVHFGRNALESIYGFSLEKIRANLFSDQFNSDYQKLIKLLKKNPEGMPRTKIYRASRWDAQRVKKVLDKLLIEEKIVEFSKPGKTKAATWYALTE